MSSPEIVTRPETDVPVVATTGVVVVGGGPAGIAAAVSAARNGAPVVLLERYPYLGGLASGAWCWCWTTCTTTPKSPCAAWPWR